ncbi:MAG TPA: bifunctional (p)ppGpp synthetase/guanosine-3',5'-bis(diphosphate) 3'-pyrophosphohydrolase [Sneathiellales bacterium]|nr:bifunctional (p)ppGpp synthetase/guanosine-3',5'-bis(diphosphate) 3'-pyrophosphohydrolase [Sneathiellales bacterium]
MIRQYELVEQVRAYDPNADESLLIRAYVFSMKAHGSQMRDSGDSYFSHPLEVAGILTGMKLDCATVVTGLLHDTIEDTLATSEQIEDLFGPEITKLVDGVTKLSKIRFPTEGAHRAENFRKLLLAMSDDIRVLLVKLADRMHNMRTLVHVKKPEKRRRIALETMEIYAPLAERMGMQGIKDELQELAFTELNPDAHNSIMKRLQYLRDEGTDMVARVILDLEQILKLNNLNVRVVGREKRAYSIWQKMERDNVPFERLSDIMAFRIIVDDVATCYAVLGILHTKWPMIPGRFKDYISTPKQNEYQSIHTTFLGPESLRIEVQIRTEEMHEVAELGVAAHWHYKANDTKVERGPYRWLRELIETLDQIETPEEFLEHTKLEMFQDQVFCFTPKGALIALPTSATSVDFAYAVHTQIGDTCVGAKVNGKRAQLRQPLLHGDQVEIICAEGQTPSPTWESFAVSAKARMAIRRFARQRQNDEYRRLGNAIADKIFCSAGREADNDVLQAAAEQLHQKTTGDLYVALGRGDLTDRQLLEAAFPGSKIKRRRDKVLALPFSRSRWRKRNVETVSINGMIPGIAIRYAECCHPIPGDRIVGIVTPGEGAMIHTTECEVLENFNGTPERWLDVSWEPDSAEAEIHVGRISTVAANEAGALGSLLTVIASNSSNIVNLKINDRSKDFFEVVIDLEVRDVKHMANIIAGLRANALVSSVNRVRG